MGGVLEILDRDCSTDVININRAVFRDSIAHEILIVVSSCCILVTFFQISKKNTKQMPPNQK